MPAYTPAPYRRYFAITNDPNSPGGSNYDKINGNTALGITADTVNFPSAAIPNVTNLWPVSAASIAWTPTRINLSNLVTGVRPGPAELPFKVIPTLSLTADSHRYIVEKIMKLTMGQEGTLTPAVYEVDSLGLGSATAGTVVIAFVWNGITYTTAPVAYNASNAALQTALLAATGPGGQTLPAGTITVTGGPLPAAATITYSGAMAGPITGQTATPTGLTGGTVTYTRTTSGTPPVHPLTGLPFGNSQAPTAMAQLIRDAVNHKMVGIQFESFEAVFPHEGVGTITAEAHPLYVQQIDDSGSPTVPTGVNPEPNTLPMLVRDATITFDGGSAEIGISELRFGWRNNSNYDRHVSGSCIAPQTLNGRNYKLWFPAYQRITGRQTVSWGFSLLDNSVAHELAAQWSQIRKIVATLVDPQGGSDQIQITLYQGIVDDGGVGPVAPTGDLPSAFNGQAFYDPVAAKDVLVNVTNNNSSPI